MTSIGWPRRTSFLLILLPLLLSALSCEKDDKKEACADCPVEPRRKPADVLTSLQLAYKHRDGAAYAKLLAQDFQFWMDPPSRPAGVPDFWTREPDSAGTACLFNSAQISDIRIALTFDSVDVVDSQVNHAGWRKILVTDTFLEVDKRPDDGVGEVTTFRISGDEQQFYFRKGISSADTLSSSPTASQWFLVEWHDLAHPSLVGERLAPAGLATTWGSLKVLYRGCS